MIVHRCDRGIVDCNDSDEPVPANSLFYGSAQAVACLGRFSQCRKARMKTWMHDGKAGGAAQHYFFGETRSTGVMYATVYRSVRRARRRAAVVYGPITAKQVVTSRYHTARIGKVNGPGPLLQKVEHQWVDNRVGLRTEHMWRRQSTRRGNQSTARHDEMQSGETPTGRLVCGRSGSLQLADIVHQWPI